MISRSLRRLSTVHDATAEAKLIELFKQHPYAPVKKEIARAMEQIRAAVLLRQNESKRFEEHVRSLAS